MPRLLRSGLSPKGIVRSRMPSDTRVVRYPARELRSILVLSAISLGRVAPPATARSTELYAAGSESSCRSSMPGSP